MECVCVFVFLFFFSILLLHVPQITVSCSPGPGSWTRHPSIPKPVIELSCCCPKSELHFPGTEPGSAPWTDMLTPLPPSPEVCLHTRSKREWAGGVFTLNTETTPPQLSAWKKTLGGAFYIWLPLPLDHTTNETPLNYNHLLTGQLNKVNMHVHILRLLDKNLWPIITGMK